MTIIDNYTYVLIGMFTALMFLNIDSLWICNKLILISKFA